MGKYIMEKEGVIARPTSHWEATGWNSEEIFRISDRKPARKKKMKNIETTSILLLQQ